MVKLFKSRLKLRFFNPLAVVTQTLARSREKQRYFTKDEFFLSLKGLGMLCTGAELDTIFRHFDRDDDGKLNLLELAHDLLKLPRPSGSKHMGLVRGRGTLSGHESVIVKKLQESAERAACPPATLAGIFKCYDRDGSGCIAYDEMTMMTSELGVCVAGCDTASLLLRHFSGGCGELTYEQFIERVLDLDPRAMKDPTKGGERLGTAEVVRTLSNNVKSELCRHVGAVSRAAGIFDEDGDGSMRLAEFRAGLSKLGLPIRSSQAKKLFAELDTRQLGELAFTEFAESVLTAGSFFF